MYRTDKQFMKNPATSSQRIYVGGLQSTVVADDLEQKFRQHGKILGLVLQRGFAFVQYETDEEAQTAIRVEQGSILHGKKIVVKHALPDRSRNAPSSTNTNLNTSSNSNMNTATSTNASISNANVKSVEQSGQQKSVEKEHTPKQVEPEPPKVKTTEAESINSPHNEEEEEELEMIAEKFQAVDEPNQQFPKKPQSIVSSENVDDDDSRSQIKKRGTRVSARNKRRAEDRFPSIPHIIERERYRGPYYSPHQDRYQDYAKPPPLMDRPERNDCEIIVVSKILTEYAEYIESRLKALGLIVDLLFPNEDVPIGRVLANISSRGCLYAILVMPQNKENQSLTLNVLHGIPQEHRNMPIDDAFLFMSRNFEAYMRGENVPPTDGSSQMTLNDKHPNSVQLLLNMLAENRLLTSVQYDKVLKYLEERRELQLKFEVNEGIEVSTEKSVGKQAELQNRIMNILNKSSDNKSQMDCETVPPPPPPTGSGPTPLLKDPTVQKALDSLLLGDMFKNISSG
ncbi:hypothetical protein WA026_014955 [Henosepilachna vigintioctopunctata]|uniref:RRM domain-containing protein n=1 Tax=Henosepilachna vigintioctopunctata TaxID=420089 RepID=A0AAW1TYP6_9CUCU